MFHNCVQGRFYLFCAICLTKFDLIASFKEGYNKLRIRITKKRGEVRKQYPLKKIFRKLLLSCNKTKNSEHPTVFFISSVTPVNPYCLKCFNFLSVLGSHRSSNPVPKNLS
jgi:hypothetical protein